MDLTSSGGDAQAVSSGVGAIGQVARTSAVAPHFAAGLPLLAHQEVAVPSLKYLTPPPALSTRTPNDTPDADQVPSS